MPQIFHRSANTLASVSIVGVRSLRWIRVRDLPDFVYFNHSIHVKKGMGCETCHGRVDEMPLMLKEDSLQMEWCLGCHARRSGLSALEARSSTSVSASSTSC